MAALSLIIDVNYDDGEDSWANWLAYPFYVLLLPAGVPVFFVAVFASAMLGGYVFDPRAELVGPVSLTMTVLLNATLVNALAKRRRSPEGASKREGHASACRHDRCQ